MRVVDLAQPMSTGMPQSPNHPPFRMVLERRHGDRVRADGGSAANEIIITGGHVGTHIDALAHVSHDGKLFGGKDFADLTIDRFAPYAGRAVLLDITALHGVATLPAGHEVTVDELEAAAQGLPIHPGEVILIGTGWSRRWAEHDAFIGLRDGTPGPGAAGAAWLAQRRPVAVGGETIAFEQIPPGRGHALLPAHRILLVEHGINIVETMNLAPLLDLAEHAFTLILAPLPVVGATGAPVRPLALLNRSP